MYIYNKTDNDKQYQFISVFVIVNNRVIILSVKFSFIFYTVMLVPPKR